MNREEIQAKVIAIAAEQAGVQAEQVTPATHFVNDLNFDSLDVVEFAMEVEDELGVTIPDDQVDKLQTVEAVVDYLAKQLNANTEPARVGPDRADTARLSGGNS